MRFAVIGDGAELKNVTAYAQACGVLNRNLFILPAVPKADMAAWISAADVATSLFIDLKELWASSANKFFEALGAGVPIAINYGGWQAELIEQTGSGLILAPRDPVSAAHMLVAALSDPAWLSSAGRAAHKLARQCFDPNRLAARLEDVLLEACGRLPAAEDEAGP
jgi:glycosyltransferase involved in cell wall biosynthesis